MVAKMQAHEYPEHQDSPMIELVAPMVFVAGLFTLLTVLSTFVG